MSEPNLIDFLLNILNGIEYGSLSTTNRAYQWMKHNSLLRGPCLSFLKNYVSPSNLVTLKQMELFQKLELKGDLPTEEEIDKELEEYFDNAEMSEFDFDNLENYSNILRNADDYLKELNLADKFQERKQNDLEVMFKVEERRKETNNREMKSVLFQSDRLNSVYNETLNNIQSELLRMSTNFDKLLRNNVNREEHNIFQINFEIFKQINGTFRDTVGIVIEKQFGNVNKHMKYNNDDREDESENGGYQKIIRTLIQVAYCFGERSLQNVQYQCEEVEFLRVQEFMSKLISNIQSEQRSTLSNHQLQSQTAVNLEVVDETQKKLSVLLENLELYYKNFIVHEIFNDERSRVEMKLKSDKKRLRKVLDLCAKFVDLLTLQALLLETEKDNVDLAIDMYHKTVSTLEDQCRKHSYSVERFKRILQNEKMKHLDDNDELTKCGADILKIDLESDEKLHIEKILMKFSTANHDVLSEIQTLADRKLNAIGMLKNSINRLDQVIFNGPARQPFFRGNLLADKRIIESQNSEFNRIFRNLKKLFKEELERLSLNEFIQIEKTLWIMFLTDSSGFLEQLQKLREQAGINKTLIAKKTESSSLLMQKSNRSSYY